MAHRVTAAFSQDVTGINAFNGLSSPDSLIVDSDAFLIAHGAVSTILNGSWTATINGLIASDGDIAISVVPTNVSDTSKIIVGAMGSVVGNLGIRLDEAGTIINHGTISAVVNAIQTTGSGAVSITNTGHMQGLTTIANDAGPMTLINKGTIEATQNAIVSTAHAEISNAGHIITPLGVSLSSDSDTFRDFIKIHGVMKSGTVTGIVDLHAGNDFFFGGSGAETVRDGADQDTYNLGGGNDTYIAHGLIGGADATDTVNGGSGIDTYDASNATLAVTVNIDKVAHLFLAQHAFGDIGTTDTVIGFENVKGGAGGDTIIGSGRANVLSGNDGADILDGLGGRDILSGGADNDIFVFEKLSDSGVKAATRDIITDFSTGDTIDISGLDSNGNAQGDPGFTFIGFKGFHGVRGELHETFSGNSTIVSGDTNGDGKADFSIALQGHHFLTVSDFDWT